MPWPTLVDQLRHTMGKILEKALALESVWQARKGRPLKGKGAQASILKAWVPDAADAVGADLDPGMPSARQTALAEEVTKSLEATLESEDADFHKLVDGWLDESSSASAPSPPRKPPKPSAQPASTMSSMLFRKPIVRSPKSKTSTKRPR